MAWFRFEVSAKGSKEETYRWIAEEVDDEVDEDEVKSLLEAWAATTALGQNSDNFTITHDEVDTLPKAVRDEMVKDTKREILRSSRVLDQLCLDSLKHPEEDKELDVWNQEVTSAIFVAEEADIAASRAWDRVMKAEEVLARWSPPGVEKTIAIEGAKTARDKSKRRREHR